MGQNGKMRFNLEKCTEFSLRESKNEGEKAMNWRGVNLKERESRTIAPLTNGLPLNTPDQFVLVLMRDYSLLVSLRAMAMVVCMSVCVCIRSTVSLHMYNIKH